MPDTGPFDAEKGGVQNGKWVPALDWDVLTDSQKIQRLHTVIKNLQGSCHRMDEILDGAVNNLESHSHDMVSGKVMTPLNRHRGYSLSGCRTEDKYF